MRPAHLLQRLSEICLALPEATKEDMGDHAAFAVRKKKFAYYLHDHHGDGIVSVCFKRDAKGDILGTRKGTFLLFVEE